MKTKFTLLVFAVMSIAISHSYRSAGTPIMSTGYGGTSPKLLRKENTDALKNAALSILERKCNVCHRVQNPRKTFTHSNMETHATKIYKQVFVTRRMPKEKADKLTAEEEQTLKQWLQTCLPEQGK